MGLYERFIVYIQPKKDKLEYYYHLDSVRISCVTEDHEGNLYVGTMNKGLYIIDSNKKWLNYLPEKDITCIYEDSKKNIWVGTKDDGLFRLDRNGVQINYKDGPYKNRLSSNYIRCIVEDNQGNYWIGTLKVWTNWIPPTILLITAKTTSLTA